MFFTILKIKLLSWYSKLLCLLLAMPFISVRRDERALSDIAWTCPFQTLDLTGVYCKRDFIKRSSIFLVFAVSNDWVPCQVAFSKLNPSSKCSSSSVFFDAGVELWNHDLWLFEFWFFFYLIPSIFKNKFNIKRNSRKRFFY